MNNAAYFSHLDGMVAKSPQTVLNALNSRSGRRLSDRERRALRNAAKEVLARQKKK